MSAAAKKASRVKLSASGLLKRSQFSARFFFFSISLLVVVVSSYFAFNQNPYPDPYQSRPISSKEWFQYPVERNAFARLPVINGVLDSFVLPDGQHIWMVGLDGLILHSDDGGTSWEKQSIGKAKEEPTLKAAFESLVKPASAAANKLVEIQAAENIVQKDENSYQEQEELAKKIIKSRSSKTVLKPLTRDPKTNQKEIQYSEVFDINKAELKEVYFADKNRGWITGERGLILSTSNGGQSWEQQNSNLRFTLRGILLSADGKTGWVFGDRGSVAKTIDGGVNWTPVNIRSGVRIRDGFIDGEAKKIWLIDNAGFIHISENAGQSWGRKEIDRSSKFSSMHMHEDGLMGWVVGAGGAIAKTTDGGFSWEKKTSNTEKSLRTVIASDNGQEVWAAGRSGTILYSDDFGRNWRLQESGIAQPIQHLSMLEDGQQVVAVSRYGLILAAPENTQNWKVLSAGVKLRFYDIYMYDDQKRGWITGTRGLIMQTHDGGESWQAVASGISESLYSIVFDNKGINGWVAGKKGIILRSTDGGRSWKQQSTNTEDAFYDIYMHDARHAWAVGERGLLLTTTDGGQNWRQQKSTTKETLRSISFGEDGKTGWAVGYRGTMLFTKNAGQSWQKQKRSTTVRLNDVQTNIDGTKAWVVASSGYIASNQPNEKPLVSEGRLTKNSLTTVRFSEDGKRGWAAGYDGVIMHTRDAGQNWQLQHKANNGRLYSLHIDKKGQAGWATGWFGSIVKTENAGIAWYNPLAEYKKYPAPWYYLSWLVALGFLLPTFKREEKEIEKEETIESLLVSDRPLEYDEPDALGFKKIANGISRFIRNENTTSPLTLAITGEWGSGKSSLMNLLKTNLKTYGFRPVWFNAWHYQKEEHLLAALLTSIYAQGIPPWWCYEGISFRLRLMIRRGWRHWVPLVVLLGVVVFSASFLIQQPGSFEDRLTFLEKSFNQMTNFFNSNDDSEANGGVVEVPSAYRPWIDGSLVTAFLGLLFTLFKGFKAFGISPARLMSSMSGRFKAKDLSQQLSFRHQFAKEFRDVTYALGDRTMVIMVDDLDRCRPESVLEVLESVNFLVSSGDCYVVLGMDPKRVVSCVGLGFKDLAAEAETDLALDKPGVMRDDKSGRAAFAINYLEKLINIEVPVPKPEKQQSINLLGVEKNDDGTVKEVSWFEQVYNNAITLGRFVAKKRYKLAVGSALVFVIASSWWYGSYLNQQQNRLFASEIVSDVQAVNTADSNTIVSDAINENGVNDQTNTEKSRSRSEFSEGQASESQWMLAVPPLLLVSSVMIWILIFRKHSIKERDSDEFTGALTIWHQLIILKQATPRSIKRFMNRVRFFAMHHKSSGGKEIGRLRQWLATRFTSLAFLARESRGTKKEIPEPMLVAMTAMHHADPDWIENEKIMSIKDDVLKSFLATNTADELDSDEMMALKESIQKHVEKFGEWPPTSEQIKQFRKISDGIYVN